MPILKVTYKNYHKQNMDAAIERVVGKLISKKGFASNNNRVIEFNFISHCAVNKVADKLRNKENIEKVEIE
jgi:hypothetical protein